MGNGELLEMLLGEIVGNREIKYLLFLACLCKRFIEMSDDMINQPNPWQLRNS